MINNQWIWQALRSGVSMKTSFFDAAVRSSARCFRLRPGQELLRPSAAGRWHLEQCILIHHKTQPQ
jgi:hypothetical protein